MTRAEVADILREARIGDFIIRWDQMYVQMDACISIYKYICVSMNFFFF